MQFNTNQRELSLKVVYYGPALSGKTTNLQALHALIDQTARGSLTTLDTKGDRTLFFDLLPMHFKTKSGLRIKLKLFTVPGQVIHEATRRIVLAGTDAVIFVADSQRKCTKSNNESFANMQRNLKANGLDPQVVPTAIQFNKRDLPDVRSDEEIRELASKGRELIFPAVAIRGEGVVETLRGTLELLYRHLESEHEFSRKLGIQEREFLAGVLDAVRPPKTALTEGTGGGG